jgi:hypothetical protein
VQELDLRSAPGLVEVMYSPASEGRALRWQRSLAAAQDWFQKELKLKVPVTLVVLNREDWKAVTPQPLPMALAPDRMIVFPEHIEDLWAGAPQGLDVVLAAEAGLFHHAGVLFADSYNLDSNAFISGLFANVFLAGYVRAARPELSFLLNGPFPGMKTPRYSSGGDLMYAGAGIQPDNFFWLELQLQRLADFCVKGRSFASVVEKLRSAFPAVHPRHVTIEDAMARMDSLFPGFRAAAGPIGDPPTMTRVRPSACHTSPKQDSRESGTAGQDQRWMVVRNDTADPVELMRPDGSKLKVFAYAWQRVALPAGTELRMSNGSCLASGEKGDPVLAILEKQ